MKKNRISLLMLLIATVFTLNSCIRINKQMEYDYDSTDIILSNVDTLDNMMIIKPAYPYEKVDIKGNFIVNFIKSNVNKVEILGNKAEIDNIYKEERYGDETAGMYIKILQRNYHKDEGENSEPIKINFHYIDLNDIELSGKVNAIFDKKYEQINEFGSLSLDLSGASVLSGLDLKNTLYVDIDLSGAAKMENVNIETANIKIDASGASNMNRVKLKSMDNIDIDLSGASKLELSVNANNLIDAEVSGASDLILTGKTSNINLDISGSSSANIKELKYKTINIEGSGASKVYR